ncbi:DUF4832 domain-containing protein [Candidatus Poribacteria bacterium]
MKYVSCLLTASLGCAMFCVSHPSSADDDSELQTVEYQGIRPTDPGGRDGLRNPERGLRIETLIAELPGTEIWGKSHHLKGRVTPGYNEQWWILDAQRYEPYGLTLAQTYCYLDGFIGKPISERKLELLQESFDNLRKRGLKAVLRFAYEKTTNKSSGPELQDILRHIDQLAPLIRKNTDVIFVMQAGFVGAWGEWHSSAHGLESDHSTLAAIIARVLDVLPADRMTQVRVPKYKRWVLEQPILGGRHQVIDGQTAHTDTPAARIGFNNDGFLAGDTCGGTWPESPHFSNPGNPEFDYMTDESPYVAIDGELFWADQGGKIEGLRAAIRMRLHHYSSFSLAHSYSEKEGPLFSIDDWVQTPLTAEDVRAAKLPLSDGYFKDASGNQAPRTQFEYIRDHLGYRIEMQRATFPNIMQVSGELTVEAELINRGFSTIHNPRQVYFVLIDTNGRVVQFPVKDADPRKWQPHEPGDESYEPLTHKISIRAQLPDSLEPGWYQLGLWMPDSYKSLRMDSRYAVRVANRNVPWWTDADRGYGINILGVVQVVQ